MTRPPPTCGEHPAAPPIEADEKWVLDALEGATVMATSERSPVYLIKSEHGAYYRLGAATLALLHLRRRGLDFDEMAAAWSRENRAAVTGEQVRHAYRGVIARCASMRAQPRRDHSFLFRLPVIPPAVVARIASALTWSFRGPWAALPLGLNVVLFAGLVASLPRPSLGAGDGLLAYALFLGTILVHEFGHAAACRRFGATPREIGLTTYLVFPAFYSDVSAAWELSRPQRVIVDLAGAYFQGATGGVLLLLYAVTGAEVFLAAIWMLLLALLLSLNPIFKFDGYWALADALGVTNLSQQRRRVLRSAWDAIRGGSGHALPWSKGVLAALAVYTVLSFAFFGQILIRLGPMLVRRIQDYPAAVGQLLEGLRGAGVADGAWGEWLRSTLMLAISLLMLFRLSQAVVAWIRAGVARLRGAPQSS